MQVPFLFPHGNVFGGQLEIQNGFFPYFIIFDTSKDTNGIQNFEQKNYGGNFTGGFQMRYQFSNIAAVYADVNFPAPKYTMFTVGIAGIIPHNCY